MNDAKARLQLATHIQRALLLIPPDEFFLSLEASNGATPYRRPWYKTEAIELLYTTMVVNVRTLRIEEQQGEKIPCVITYILVQKDAEDYALVLLERVPDGRTYRY